MMSSDSEPKRQHFSEVDIISNLPDCVLAHMLSFMPTTKQVVATSILSKRWRYVWTFVDKLIFDNWHYSSYRTVDKQRPFAPSVYNVLKLHQGNIKELSLACHELGCNEFDVTNWINTAISRGVQKLDVSTHSSYKFPLSVFTCKTLVDLKISDAYFEITNMNVPLEPFFPCLKKLDVRYCRSQGCDSATFKHIVSRCSTLEHLILNTRKTPVDIVSSSLKRLHVTPLSNDEKILLLGIPSLEYLLIDCILPATLIEDELSSLVEAHIKFLESYSRNRNAKQLRDSFVRFIHPLCNVEVLRIESHLQKFFNSVGHAQFPNLTKLEIVSPFFEWRLLVCLMESSMNLEAISLKKTSTLKKHKLAWKEPKHVPACLPSSLRKLSLNGYSEDELTMVKYVLRFSQILERIEICCANYIDNKWKPRMLQNILKLHRACEKCQISLV